MWQKIECSEVDLSNSTGKRLFWVDVIPLCINGATQIDIELHGEVFQADIEVADSIVTDLILGRYFIKIQHWTIESTLKKDVSYAVRLLPWNQGEINTGESSLFLQPVHRIKNYRWNW